jgi:predicted unusual protein kinase regulating ubiquinone biosynthesis (AarF/ABC1/UbiB family)
MIFTDNFIHSDLHPGNVLIRMQGTGKKDAAGEEIMEPIVIFLDCGIVQEVR